MLISITKNAVLYTIYDYDTTLFITMFCENIDRPQMKCDGKCFLAKMQKEQDEKDAANTLKQVQSEIVYYNSIQPILIGKEEMRIVDNTKKLAYYNKLYAYLFTTDLVKPPPFISIS